MKRLYLGLALLGAACGSIALPDKAAAVATTKVTLTSTAWSDLGVGPLQVNSGGTQVFYAIADTTPPLPVVGFAVPTNTNQVVNTASHVWAIAATPNAASVVVAPVAGTSGSGGTFTWPGSATVTSYGVAPTGTVPAVNSFCTNCSAATLTWPGTAGNGVIGAAATPGSTAPYVNAYIVAGGGGGSSGPLGTQPIANSQAVNPATASVWNTVIGGTLPAFTTNPTIANTAFGISGTLPPFASPPSVTIGGTLPPYASPPSVTITGTLPAFTANPTIANTAFGISGTLPAFAAPPTIANTAFGISGTLPAFATTPNVNITGTLPAFTTNPTIANTSFGISGTLPAFAAPPTIANTSFGISGTLPAYASTPTMNINWPGTAGLATGGTAAAGGSTMPYVNSYIVGGGGALTWPGTAGNATGGTAATGGTTMPYVNAYIVNGASGGTSSSFGTPFPPAGTAAGFQYLSAPPTLTTGQMVAGQTDVNGNLKVAVVSGGASNPSVSATGTAAPAQATYMGMLVAGNLVGAPGSANGMFVAQPTAANLNATVAQPTAAALNATIVQPTAANLNATVVGTVTAAQSTAANLNATVAQPTAANLNATVVQGTAANLNATVVGTVTANGGTNLNTSLLATSANQNVTAAGVSATSGQGVQFVTGGVPFNVVQPVASNFNATVIQPTAANLNANVSQATPANLNATVVQPSAANLNATVSPVLAATWGLLAQNATTSAQLGQLMLGAVTTAAPSYTTAQSSALSLTTAGALRVDSSTTTQPTSTAVNVTSPSCSVAITTANVAQNLPNLGTASIHGFHIVNKDSATGGGEGIGMNYIGTASLTPSDLNTVMLPPPQDTKGTGQGSFTTSPGEGINHAVSVIAATAGHVIFCSYW